MGLAATFLLAGTLKLSDLGQSRSAIAAFGIPLVASRWLGTVLPFFEIGIGAMLLFPGRFSIAAATAAFALLVLFAGVIAANLALGRRPHCNCFGHARSKPIGAVTFARNVLLAAAAAFVVVMGPLHALAIPGSVLAGGAAAGFVAAQSLFVWQLFRQNGRLLLRIEQIERQVLPAPAGLPLGAQVPVFEAIPQVPGEAAVIVFMNPECPPCQALMPDIAVWQGDARNSRIAVITGQPDVANAYAVSGTPAAVFVRADGAIGSPVVFGRDAIAALVASHRVSSHSTPRYEDRSELTYGTASR